MSLTVNGVQTTATATNPLQGALNDALGRLGSFNQLKIAENPDKFVDLNKYFGSQQVAQWKAPYEQELRALANKTPPLSESDFNAQANKIIQRFEMKAFFMREMRFQMFTQMMEQIEKMFDMVKQTMNLPIP